MPKFTIPPGKATGCLPRASNVGEWAPKASDRIEVIPASEVMDRIKVLQETHRTLTYRIRHFFDQDGIGSCAGESSTDSLQLVKLAEGQPWELLNPWTVYRYLTKRDKGSSIDSNLRRLVTHGVLPDRVWPRYDAQGDVVHHWTEYPSESLFETEGAKHRIHEFLDVETWEEFRTCLLMGKPVVFGHDVHAEVVVELLDLDRFLVKNSWGERPDKLHPMHRREIEWNYGAFCPVSAVDAGDV